VADSFLRRVIGGGAGGSRRRDEPIESLTAAVGKLADAQRKQAAQIKKLVETQKEQNHRWRDEIERWQQEGREAARRERRDTLRAAERQQKRWQTGVGALEDAAKAERKWRRIFTRQMSAMMRALQLSRLPLTPPHDIAARRFRLWSQNEEDGIILALLEHAGITDRRFVEIGSGSSGGNAAMLAYECGWSGLMIDVIPEAIAKLRRRFAHNPGVIGVAAAVSPGNVDQLLTDHGFTGQIDLLSIDIDSYEYWVLEALEAVSPRVLIVEYNAGFGGERAVTVPKDQPLAGAPKAYRGASLPALEKLARRKGYRLVVCDPTGTNAFFLRHDIAPGVPGVSVAQAFRPAIDQSSLEDTPISGDRLAELAGLPLVDV
jgi:predicted O-methyltransferase YrrM